MKNFYLSILVLLFVFLQSSLYAQENNSTRDTTSRKSFQHVHFGIYGGGTVPMYQFAGEGMFNGLKGTGSFSRTLGGYIEIGVPSFLEGMSIQVGIMQQQKVLLLTEHIDNSADSFTNYDIDYKMSFLKAPLLINYQFSNGKFRPYAHIGYGVGLSAVAQHNELVTTNQYNKSLVESSNEELFTTIENESSIIFGVGAMYMLTNRMGAFLQVQYSSDKHRGIHNGKPVGIYSKMINLSGGIRF